MGRGKSFVLLLLIAAGLGAYVYFVEMKREPASATPADANRKKVFAITAGTVEALTLTNADKATTRLAKKDTTWHITEPAAAEADTVEVSTVVSSIESLEQTRVVAENPPSGAPFGLEPARIVVTFRVAGDSAPKTLQIGNKTPTGGDLYARVEGSPAVFLIGGYLEDTFNKKPFDLREKSVLKFARDAADSMTIVHGTSRLEFSKTGTDWRLTAPVNARADFAAVDGWVGRLFQARMTTLVESDANALSAAKLREYGLDKPRATVTVGSGSSQAQLALGAAQGDAHVYARDLSRPLVFTVEKALFDELDKKADDVRVKDLFEFRSFNATSFEVVSGGTTYALTKKKGEGENAADVWSLTAPSAKTVDATKMTDLLTTASNLRAESFVATPHASGETVTITAKFGEGDSAKSETVTLRKSGTTVHGMRAGEPGAAVVSTVDFDRVMALLKEIAG